jgi:tetratricopeptide (TPR) repeat protein
MNGRVFGLVLLIGAVACTTGAGPPPEATAWLDRAGRWAQQINDPADMAGAAYDRADVLYQLAIEEAVSGRQDQAVMHTGALRAAVVLIAAADGDPWPYAYLPGPLTVGGQDVEARVTFEMLESDVARLDAAQMTAEALAIKDDADAYARATQRIEALLPKAQAELIAEAAEDAAWEYDGLYTGWFIMRMCRDQGDLAGARRFAAFDWRDPAEHAGVLAILAQLEVWQGDPAQARALADRATARLSEALDKQRANPDTYFPDLDTHLPEVVVALWLLDGQDAALKFGQDHAQAQTIWQDAADAHAALMLRRMGQPESAEAALDRALARRFGPGDEPMNWDTLHLTRELVRQGRTKELEPFLARSESPAFRAFACLGAAQGVLRPDRGE